MEKTNQKMTRWLCVNCGNDNYPFYMECVVCGSPRIEVDERWQEIAERRQGE